MPPNGTVGTVGTEGTEGTGVGTEDVINAADAADAADGGVLAGNCACKRRLAGCCGRLPFIFCFS